MCLLLPTAHPPCGRRRTQPSLPVTGKNTARNRPLKTRPLPTRSKANGQTDVAVAGPARRLRRDVEAVGGHAAHLGPVSCRDYARRTYTNRGGGRIGDIGLDGENG